jgi:myosin heavy subunit
MADDDFKFPDEIENEAPAPEVEASEEDKIEIEIVDDRPEEDQKNSQPLPESIVKEIDEDDLEKYNSEAKQRLLQMKKLINDERRAKEQALREQQEAIRVAQSLVEETKKLKGRLTEGEKVYVSNAKEGAERQLELARISYKEAYDSGDSDRVVDAQEKLTEAKFKMHQVESYRPQYDESALQTEENEVKIPEQSQQPQRLDSKTQAWLDKNSWYGSDDDMSFLAMGIHRRLERDGVTTGSDQYWSAIDTEMRKRFPEKFAGENTAETKDSVKKPSTVVAPATRSTSPKKIRLTQTQLALAKKFKLSPEQYAMELTKLESQNG